MYSLPKFAKDVRTSGLTGSIPPLPNPPRTAATGQVFTIIFQDFGKIILKNNLEKQSRLFFKILVIICLNKIIDFTIYLTYPSQL